MHPFGRVLGFIIITLGHMARIITYAMVSENDGNMLLDGVSIGSADPQVFGNKDWK